jgi:ABC-type glycerol-3-phosphate transport system permease component
MPAANLLQRASFFVGVTVIVAVSLFPFFWIVRTSLQSEQEFAEGVTGLLPRQPTAQSYVDTLTGGDFLRPLLNSTLICLGTTAVTVVLATLAGYALSRLAVPGSNVVLGFVLLAGFFPVLAMVGPMFLMARRVDLLDSNGLLVFMNLVYTLPISTWLLKSFFDQIPASLEEAAMVDGATRLQALRRVVVPVAAPGVFTSAILSFILSWNDFAFALSFLQTPSKFTAPLAIVNLGQSQFQVFHNRIDAAVVIISVPIVVLVLLAQRRIVSGLTAGAVK